MSPAEKAGFCSFQPLVGWRDSSNSIQVFRATHLHGRFGSYRERLAMLQRILMLFCLVSTAVYAQKTTGDWIVESDFLGSKMYDRAELVEHDGAISGSFMGQAIVGRRDGNDIVLEAPLGTEKIAARFEADTIRGTTAVTTGSRDKQPLILSFVATRVPKPPLRPPLTHIFTPKLFYRDYSATNPPALHIAPGDTVRTETVDNGGSDSKNVRRTAGGDPQTGPFFIDSVMPGDMLVVHIVKLTLNRDTAISDDALASRALNRDLAVATRDNRKQIVWHLDRDRMVGWPADRSGHLAAFEVPLRPMLACIGTAPDPGPPAPASFDNGNWGGNMDFNEIGTGTTVYLPVNVPGALLYLVGDAHALQADGELNGTALETSMDVEFSVDVIPKKSLKTPRVETATYIAATGFDGTVDGHCKPLRTAWQTGLRRTITSPHPRSAKYSALPQSTGSQKSLIGTLVSY